MDGGDGDGDGNCGGDGDGDGANGIGSLEHWNSDLASPAS